jgi:hypothetical protein
MSKDNNLPKRESYLKLRRDSSRDKCKMGILEQRIKMLEKRKIPCEIGLRWSWEKWIGGRREMEQYQHKVGYKRRDPAVKYDTIPEMLLFILSFMK